MSADTPADDGSDDLDGGSDERAVAARLDAIDGPVLLFDGVCNLCNAAVRFVVRFDAAGTFRFAPLQSEVGQALLERHDLSTETFDSVVLIEDGAVATKSTAALRVARRLDGPWPLLYPAIALPTRVRDGAYDLVAEYRYRVFGKKDQCPVPEPEIRDRFLQRRLD
ncbi:thiol-disulfide oxidoreductase DCC family protein [Halomicrobium sp. LC1Hm]|uniref:thiol-disulfide oxidoreductase DCC family protein n=1 Tax=Halomicrobium sp. LC1Hm TaxID=2610902 RepID=UPI0012A8B6A2|nr:thiol-disulfide oxidoreductase DCC family protein [Halomicrobium sp. LC1Hm]QGA81754.1 Uncharacterized protein LC1Hm_0690 [Halomicrobium sp. LC1Hm]